MNEKEENMIKEWIYRGFGFAIGWIAVKLLFALFFSFLGVMLYE